MKRPIFDPEALPVQGTDVHLPPVPQTRLQPATLRQILARPPVWAPEPIDEAWYAPPREGLRPASVLVPIVLRESGHTVLLTRRTAHLHDHGGQISFPGGRVENGDVDVVATALRETEEEIGLARTHVEVLCSMPEYLTGTGYRITPVVGLVHPPFELCADTFEVAEVFEVPLDFLMNPANHQRRMFRAGDLERSFFSMPFPKPDGHYFIWGATAGMLRNLYRLLAAD